MEDRFFVSRVLDGYAVFDILHGEKICLCATEELAQLICYTMLYCAEYFSEKPQ